MNELWNERVRRFVLWPIRRRITRLARVSHHGHTLLIDTRDEVIGHHLYLGREWEPSVSVVLSLLDLDGTVVVDAGANIGVHTLDLSRAVGRSGRVLAFEPESRSFDLLKRNLALNSADNVSAQNVALGDHAGRARLAPHPWNRGDHRILLESENSPENVQEVQITTLDDFCLPLGPNALSLIKIDVQGYEAQVLRGAQATIDANPDVWLIFEIPSAASRQLTPSADLVRWFVDRGFHGFELHPDRLVPLLAPEAYSMLFEYDTHVLLSRNEQKLQHLVQAYCEHHLGANRE